MHTKWKDSKWALITFETDDTQQQKRIEMRLDSPCISLSSASTGLIIKCGITDKNETWLGGDGGGDGPYYWAPFIFMALLIYFHLFLLEGLRLSPSLSLFDSHACYARTLSGLKWVIVRVNGHIGTTSFELKSRNNKLSLCAVPSVCCVNAYLTETMGNNGTAIITSAKRCE